MKPKGAKFLKIIGVLLIVAGSLFIVFQILTQILRETLRAYMYHGGYFSLLKYFQTTLNSDIAEVLCLITNVMYIVVGIRAVKECENLKSRPALRYLGIALLICIIAFHISLRFAGVYIQFIMLSAFRYLLLPIIFLCIIRHSKWRE